jgi:hypothetical protein
MARDLHQTEAARDSDDDLAEPPQLRRFRRLVSLLMVVMMLGILGITAALIWKLTRADSPGLAPPIAADIAIPSGFEVLSVSRAGSRLYLLLEDADSGERFIEERSAKDRELLGQYRLVPTKAD